MRARMVEAASRLYAEGGNRALSFGVVAKQTGLTKATVFHYFPNKEALLLAVFETFGKRLEEAALGWFDAPPESYAARLDRLVSSLIDFYGTDPLHARILCHGLLEADGRGRWRVGGGTPEVFAHFVARFADFVRGGIAAGEFYPDRPMALILAIGGTILFELMLPGQGRGFSPGLSLAERCREMTRLIRRAVVRPAARLGARDGAAPGRDAHRSLLSAAKEADGGKLRNGAAPGRDAHRSLLSAAKEADGRKPQKGTP